MRRAATGRPAKLCHVTALACERAAIAMFQENDMQPKSIHGAAPGFRVLDQNVTSAVVGRQMRPTQMRPSLTNLTDEQDMIHRRADRSIDFDFYRRRATAPRARAPHDAAMWISASAGMLTMAAIYLALFLAAAHMRAANDIQPAGPVVAIPNAPDVIF
jgi:hypothetical protein